MNVVMSLYAAAYIPYVAAYKLFIETEACIPLYRIPYSASYKLAKTYMLRHRRSHVAAYRYAEAHMPRHGKPYESCFWQTMDYMSRTRILMTHDFYDWPILLAHMGAFRHVLARVASIIDTCCI